MSSLLLLPAALLLLAVAIELGSRWWIRHRNLYYVLPPGARIHLRPDPTISPRLEQLVRYEVNAQGERGGEVPRSSSGLYRVLVAGGSQPEGYLLDQDTNWPGRLQCLLQAPEHLKVLHAAGVHVGNIGRSGVGSEALEIILHRVLGRYPRLQLIVILVGASDVLRWLEVGATFAPPPPVQTSEVFRCHPEVTFAWKPGQLALVELLRRMRQRWLRPTQVHERACAWIGKARSMRARAKDYRTSTPDATAMLAHFDAHFRRALKKAQAHADRVLVVRQPWFDKHCTPEEAAQMWHGGVGQAWREEVTTFYSDQVLSRLMAALDARAASVAQELGIEHLDLMPILEPSLDHYYDFFHATPSGATAIALSVMAAVLRKPRRSTKPDGVQDAFAQEWPDQSGAIHATGHGQLGRLVS